jgi:phosphatidylinositol alpha-1,6-mannosyltransferase
MIVTRNLPPMVGGIESMIGEIAKRLMPRYRLTIASPLLTAINTNHEDECKFINIPGSTPLEFLIHGTVELAKAIRYRKFAGVICSSGLSAVVYWRSKYFTPRKIVVLAHGLDIARANSDYQYKATLLEVMSHALTIANSKYTAALIKRVFSSDDMNVITILPPPRVLDIQSSSIYNRNVASITSRPFLLSVGRAIERKGIHLFISKSLPAILAKYPNLQYIIAGPNSDDPKYVDYAFGNIRQEYHKNLHFIGYVTDTTLSDLYKRATALIFPVQEIENNPEGLGLVILEAATFGTPSIAFATGGVPEAIKRTKQGRIVSIGNFDQFSGEVIDVIKMRNDVAVSNHCKTINARNDIENKWEKYINQIATALEG